MDDSFIASEIERLQKIHHKEIGLRAGSALRVAALEGALRQIEKGEGAFSMDQLTFASNVINAAKEAASTALRGSHATGAPAL